METYQEEYWSIEITEEEGECIGHFTVSSQRGAFGSSYIFPKKLDKPHHNIFPLTEDGFLEFIRHCRWLNCEPIAIKLSKLFFGERYLNILWSSCMELDRRLEKFVLENEPVAE